MGILEISLGLWLTLTVGWGGVPGVPSSDSWSHAAQAVATASATPAKAYSREKDPQWYAEQQALLYLELERIDGSIRVIRDFRKAGKTITGAIAFEEQNHGITPEAGIENLGKRRREILSKIDRLEDLARRNEVPPGEVRSLTDRLVEKIKATPAPLVAPTPSEAADLPDPQKDPEAYWRKRFADQREKLFWAEKELSILVRELGELWKGYFPDPNEALREQLTLNKITRHRKAIEQKQREITQLRQGLSDLEDELRRAGGYPGWAR